MGQSSSRPNNAPPRHGHARHASHSLAQAAQQQQQAPRRDDAADREAKLYAAVALDHGALGPVNALYDAGAADFEPKVLRRLILERKLAPFYRGLADPDDGESTTTTTVPRPRAPDSPASLPAQDFAPTPIQIAMTQNGPGFGDGGPVVALGRSATASEAAGVPIPSRFKRGHAHKGSTGSLAASFSSTHSGTSAAMDSASGIDVPGAMAAKQRAASAGVASSYPSVAGPSRGGGPAPDPLLGPNNLAPWISRDDLYRNSIECPICFLYYPRNINWSRCCDQPICSECFVQIQRPESGDPAACPFCVEPNFGIIYYAPNTPMYLEKSGRADDPDAPPLPIAADHLSQSLPADSPLARLEGEEERPETPASVAGKAGKREGKKRRESMGSKAPGVVTVDDLRPGWFKKHQQQLLARAIQQQQRRYASLLAASAPGSRPPPPPSSPPGPSGDEHEPDLIGAATAAAALVESMSSQELAAAQSRRRGLGTSRGQRQSRGGNQNLRDQVAIAGYFDAMRHMGADLEELMMMEAMRRSLQDVTVSPGGPSDGEPAAGPADPSPEPPADPPDGKPGVRFEDDTSSPVVSSFVESAEEGAGQ
ncbi:hypothetical protein DFJ74DRAFT_360406 [Hyaloraphidium curvatum]|nr:hypothetical protein DFJ74DRAFT_360406 [Hyaloraphidium curvatum]